jgi:thiamine biosynthesis lipoprotein
VAAATCADANAAATAAIVGGGRAEERLTADGMPARLVAHDGQVRYVGGWPVADGGRIEVSSGSHVYGRVRAGGLR